MNDESKFNLFLPWWKSACNTFSHIKRERYNENCIVKCYGTELHNLSWRWLNINPERINSLVNSFINSKVFKYYKRVWISLHIFKVFYTFRKPLFQDYNAFWSRAFALIKFQMKLVIWRKSAYLSIIFKKIKCIL